jgi:putative ABC transport system permease protein
LGDVLEIPAPGGILRLPVTGVVDDYSDQQGTLLINRGLFIRYWHDDSVNVFRVYVASGAEPAQVRQRILAAFGGRQRLFVLTNSEVRDFITKLTDQWFGLTNVQTAVAVLVAILGIVNALTVSITDRRRELGVLQAVGGLRNQIRHTIWMEAVAIGIIGVALGLALGAVQLFYSIEIARRDLVGISIDYEYPFQTALILIPVILGSALFAALGPAESAVRGSLIEALEYE